MRPICSPDLQPVGCGEKTNSFGLRRNPAKPAIRLTGNNVTLRPCAPPPRRPLDSYCTDYHSNVFLQHRRYIFFQKINWMKPTPTTAKWPIRPVNCHLTTWRCTAKSGDSPSSSRLSCVLLMHFWFWFFARDECQLSPHLAYRADWPNERSPGSGPPFEANYLCCAFHLYTQRQSNFNLFLRALPTGNRRFRVNWNDFQY